MAEEEGFEPPIPFQVRQFSRLEPSTTRPLFRTTMINHGPSAAADDSLARLALGPCPGASNPLNSGAK